MKIKKEQELFEFCINSIQDYIKTTIKDFIASGKLSKSDAVTIMEKMRVFSKRHKNESELGKLFEELLEKYKRKKTEDRSQKKKKEARIVGLTSNLTSLC